jgi:two-component system, chemotaxis family, CheB/CheR fusion protein
MLAAERAESLRKPLSLKIFATDSQEDNLRIARDGIYPAAATAAIGPERLRRFFEALDGFYQMKKICANSSFSRRRTCFAIHHSHGSI